jgi:hypothetical protein
LRSGYGDYSINLLPDVTCFTPFINRAILVLQLVEIVIAMSRIFRFARLLLTLSMGFILLLTTACSNPTIEGARPDNPPVQMGGNNNPYEGSGGSYDHSGMKTEAPTQRNVSALPTEQAVVPGQPRLRLVSNSVTYSLAAENEAKLPYPGTGMENEDVYKVDLAEAEVKRQEAQQIPKEKQYIVDRSDPNAKILERSVQAFKSASEFLNERSRAI